jgi:hypothetical protein
MSIVLRRNRKGSNEEIIRCNAVGMSLSTIAEKVNCHPTSITLRLKSLKIRPADTRRNFMDDVFRGLPDGHQDHVANILMDTTNPEGPKSIKDYIMGLVDESVKKAGTKVCIAFLCALTFYPFPPDVAICPSMKAGTMAMVEDDDEVAMPALPFTVGTNGIPIYA